MKKKTKWILGSVAGIILVACIAGFIYFKYFFTLHLFEEGPTTKVTLSDWSKLEKGMTREQVISLLGDSSVKWGPGTFSIGSNEFAISERWEYNWTVGFSLFGEVHPKAYVVYFDDEGRLASWREPEETNETADAESRTSGSTATR